MKKQLLTVLILILTAQGALQSREFLNTVLHLNFGGMYTITTAGNIIDSENKEIDTSIPGNTNISHYETAYCGTLDIVPFNPILLGMEEHAVKFGVRGSYRFSFLQQRVTDEVELGDKVLDYKSWVIGPVIHYAPFIEPSDLNEDYTASGGFTFFALAGKIDGNLTAFPAVREKTDYSGANSTSISGYKYDIGVGAEIALCSLNFGTNIYYSYMTFDMKDKIYPDTGKSGYLKEICLEIYVGIPIESFIEPLIPAF